jgi:hypothetical protein
MLNDFANADDLNFGFKNNKSYGYYSDMLMRYLII